MNEQQFNTVIQALKLEILTLLQESDLTKDKEAQRVLLTIHNTFNRLGAEIDTVLPPLVLQEYFAGLEEANNDLYVYNVEEEKMAFYFAEGIETNQQMQVIQATLKNHLHYEAVAEISENMMMDLKAAIRTARDNAEISIVNSLADVQRDLQSGVIRGDSRLAITKRVMESFERNGFTSFVTKDGAKLPLDSYAQTVTRTNLKKAHTKGASNRYRERNINLFKVTGGYPTCSDCAAYRDIVFTMDRDNDDFPYLDPNAIPFHPNCQCSIRPFVIEYASNEEIDKEKEKAKGFDPDKDTRSTSQQKAYKRKQAMNRQNAYEKKRYAEIKAIMGDDAPKTLGAFKRMKRAGTSNYQDLLMDFNDAKEALRKQGMES